MTSRLRTIRQRLRFLTPDGAWVDVTTRPFHYDLWARSRVKHPDWPPAEDNPVGFLVFLAWAAARDEHKIDAGLTFEAFRDTIVDLAELPTEPVDPTPSSPGGG